MFVGRGKWSRVEGGGEIQVATVMFVGRGQKYRSRPSICLLKL